MVEKYILMVESIAERCNIGGFIGEKGSLKARLMVLFILFTIIPATVGGVINSYMNISATKSAIVQNNSNTAAQVARQVEIRLDDSKGVVEGLALTAHPIDGPAIREILVAMQQKNPQFELVFIMNTSGMQVARSTGNMVNRSDRQYFKEAMKGNTYYSNVYMSGSTNSPTITISTPIKDGNGAIIGVMAADVNLKELESITINVKIGKNGYIDIFDQVGNLVAHPDQKKVVDQENFIHMEHVLKVINGQSGWLETLSTRGDQTLTTFAPIGKYKWGVIVNQPVKEIYEGAIFSICIIAVILLLSIAVAIVVAFYIARSIADPLGKVVTSVGFIAEGDLSHTLVIEGVSEVNKLVSGVNKMVVSLRKITMKSASASQSVAASAEEMMASAEQSAQASDQVARAITDVAEGVYGQLQLVDSTVAVVDRISKEILQVAANTTIVAAAAIKTEQAANDGGGSIEKAITQMHVIEQKTNETGKVIAELEEKSKQISQMIEKIATIAGKTNLLTRNAAGGTRNDFAAVADEVSKLTDQSQDIVKQITDLIVEIQQKTNSAVVFINEGKKEVSTGSKIVSLAGKSFREIIQMMKERANQINELSSATQQIARETQNLVSTVLGINVESKKISQQAETVSAATEEQSASMEEIALASESLAKMAEELQETLEIFKL